ncbi:hypothetical protein BH09ACT7_BH09ACT7_20310 [soil metagenome]
MTTGRRVALELTLACLAVAGAVWSGLNVTAIVDVPPIMEGQPATTSVEYNPPVLVLTLLLATVAAVLVIVAVARWRRSARGAVGVPT